MQLKVGDVFVAMQGFQKATFTVLAAVEGGFVCSGVAEKAPTTMFFRAFTPDAQPLGAHRWKIPPPPPVPPEEIYVLNVDHWRTNELIHGISFSSEKKLIQYATLVLGAQAFSSKKFVEVK